MTRRHHGVRVGGLLLGGMLLVMGAATLEEAPEARRSASCAEDAFELLDIDTLFYVHNRGLARLFVVLNGHAFKLVTDPAERQHSANAFVIPRYGEITIGIGAYMVTGEANCMTIRSQGAPGSDADLVIGDLLVPGQRVAYAIGGLQPLPERFVLARSFPNPFREAVTVTYEIPEAHSNGVPVSLAIYDLGGRRVRSLVEARQFPGRFTASWDGRGAAGERVASGTYLCRLVAGPYAATALLVLLD